MNHHSNSSQNTYEEDLLSPNVKKKDLETEERKYYKFQGGKILTPWSIGGLLIILLSNLLLIWTQWQQQEAIKTINQTKVETKPSTIDIAQPITLQSLSLLRGTKARPTNISSQTSIEAPIIRNTSPKIPYSMAPQTTNLSTVLLPKSLSPETTRTQYIKTQSQKQQVQGGSKSSYNNPLPVPSPPPIPDKIRNQQIIEQNRLETEQSQPLGFNHKTRAKMQAIENNQDPNEVIRNMQQLQQERINGLPAPSTEK